MKLIMIVATAILALTTTVYAAGPARNGGHSPRDVSQGRSVYWGG